MHHMLRSARPTTRLRVETLEDRWVPATLFVDDGGSKQFQTITQAVAAAQPGDNIIVLPGTYAESVTITTDRISLRSQKAHKAIIDPTGSVQAVVRVQGADDVEVRGFSIRGSADFGVQVDEGGSAEIENNLITGTTTDPIGYGVLIGGRIADNPSNPTGGTAEVEKNTIRGYTLGGVFVFDDESNAEVTHNTVTGVGPTNVDVQYGVIFGFGGSGEASHNTISKNDFIPEGIGTESAGIYAYLSGDVVIRHNDTFQNEDGILIEDNDGSVLVAHNKVTRNTRDGIVLSGDFGVTGAVIEHNDVSRNARDGIVVVSASTDNRIANNDSTANGRNGLRIDEQAFGNTITKNDLRGNAGLDAFDWSGGAQNFWVKNKFNDGNIVFGS